MEHLNPYRAEAVGLPSQTLGSRVAHNNKRLERCIHRTQIAGHGKNGKKRRSSVPSRRRERNQMRVSSDGGMREGKLEKVARQKLYIGGARVSWKYMVWVSVPLWARPKWSVST